ncbi:MAG TPA: acetyltransferase [Candidatus Baltobacteraceae bacterium]|nr:acetyltransferase [Candidatus Baltobacteraceae bacterium]
MDFSDGRPVAVAESAGRGENMADKGVSGIILWGGAGQAIVLGELYARLKIPIVAIVDDDPKITSPFSDVPLYSGVDFKARLLPRLSNEERSTLRALVAMGSEQRGKDRIALGEWFESSGIALATAIHPEAFVATDARIGAGSQILAMSAVAARAEIGRSCIINTKASVDHECVLEDGVHVACGATLAGYVQIGRAAFIGAGATVLPRRRIGANAIVGAGAVVTRDVTAGTVVVGNPARPLARHG